MSYFFKPFMKFPSGTILQFHPHENVLKTKKQVKAEMKKAQRAMQKNKIPQNLEIINYEKFWSINRHHKSNSFSKDDIHPDWIFSGYGKNSHIEFLNVTNWSMKVLLEGNRMAHANGFGATMAQKASRFMLSTNHQFVNAIPVTFKGKVYDAIVDRDSISYGAWRVTTFQDDGLDVSLLLIDSDKDFHALKPDKDFIFEYENNNIDFMNNINVIISAAVTTNSNPVDKHQLPLNNDANIYGPPKTENIIASKASPEFDGDVNVKRAMQHFVPLDSNHSGAALSRVPKKFCAIHVGGNELAWDQEGGRGGGFVSNKCVVPNDYILKQLRDYELVVDNLIEHHRNNGKSSEIDDKIPENNDKILNHIHLF